MEKHFMIDIETTGVDPETDDLLQIGILEMDYVDGFWRTGKSFEITQHSGRRPESSFAKEHMVPLYDRCNSSPWIKPEIIRKELLQFFNECGSKPPTIYTMGWNASNFDLPFLFHHRCLVPSGYAPGPDGKDVMIGDVHYRIYEIGGAVSLVSNAIGHEDRKTLCKIAEGAGDPYVELPKGKEHDAIYDCYNQARILNGLIALTRAKYVPNSPNASLGEKL